MAQVGQDLSGSAAGILSRHPQDRLVPVVLELHGETVRHSIHVVEVADDLAGVRDRLVIQARFPAFRPDTLLFQR